MNNFINTKRNKNNNLKSGNSKIGFIVIIVTVILVLGGAFGLVKFFANDKVQILKALSNTMNSSISNREAALKKYNSVGTIANDFTNVYLKAEYDDYLNMAGELSIDDKNKIIKASYSYDDKQIEGYFSEIDGVLINSGISYGFSPETIGKDYNNWADTNDVLVNSQYLPSEVNEDLSLTYDELTEIINEFKGVWKPETGELAELIKKAIITKSKSSISFSGSEVKTQKYDVVLKKEDVNEYYSSMSAILNDGDIEVGLNYEAIVFDSDVNIVFHEYKKNIISIDINVSHDVKVSFKLINPTKPEEGMDILIDTYDAKLKIMLNGYSEDKDKINLDIKVETDNSVTLNLNLNIDLNSDTNNLNITASNFGVLSTYLGINDAVVTGNCLVSKSTIIISLSSLTLNGASGSETHNFDLLMKISSDDQNLSMTQTDQNLFDIDAVEMSNLF